MRITKKDKYENYVGLKKCNLFNENEDTDGEG